MFAIVVFSLEDWWEWGLFLSFLPHQARCPGSACRVAFESGRSWQLALERGLLRNLIWSFSSSLDYACRSRVLHILVLFILWSGCLFSPKWVCPQPLPRVLEVYHCPLKHWFSIPARCPYVSAGVATVVYHKLWLPGDKDKVCEDLVEKFFKKAFYRGNATAMGAWMGRPEYVGRQLVALRSQPPSSSA